MREMDKKTQRIPPTDDKLSSNIDMESGLMGTRWAIPRPSLACSVSSIESASRVSQSIAASKSRGSASSQGSTSNHSTHSASSGSLLLSAANLSKMNTLHTANKQNDVGSKNINYQNNLSAYVHSSGRPHVQADVRLAMPSTPEPSDSHTDPFWRNIKLPTDKNQRVDAGDNVSVASSTHFTVVNGFTRHNKNTKNEKQMWCCKSSHQITVLVVTMTILFTAGILAAICYVEMRQRSDVGSRFS